MAKPLSKSIRAHRASATRKANNAKKLKAEYEAIEAKRQVIFAKMAREGRKSRPDIAYAEGTPAPTANTRWTEVRETPEEVKARAEAQIAVQAETKRLSASGILDEASGIVAGARGTTHGDKERSFEAIAHFWNTFLFRVRQRGGENSFAALTARDVAQMMVLLKMARAEQGTAIRDHFVDAAGYAAIAGEISGKGKP